MRKEWIIFEATGITGILLFSYSIINKNIDFNWSIGVLLGIILGIYINYMLKIMDSIISVVTRLKT